MNTLCNQACITPTEQCKMRAARAAICSPLTKVCVPPVKIRHIRQEALETYSISRRSTLGGVP